MEIAGFVVALVALFVSLALALHALSAGPRLKVVTQIMYRWVEGRYEVIGVRVTLYNLGRAALPVEGVGVGGAEPKSLSYAHPDAVAALPGGSENPTFPLTLAPGNARNVLLVRDLEPGKFLRVQYFERRWRFGPMHEARWDKPVTKEMRPGSTVER